LQTRHARGLASLIAAQADVSLRESDITAVRRLMLDVQSTGSVASCRVMLPGVGVIASTSAAEIDVMDLPASWDPAMPLAEQPVSAGLVRVSFDVQNRGSGVIEVATPTQPSVLKDTMLKAMLIGGVLSALLLVGFSRVARGFSSLVAIGSALRTAADGERRIGVLSVDGTAGGLGAIWNAMLSEHDVLQARLADRAVQERVGQGGVDGAAVTAACGAMASGVLVFDASGDVLYANGAAAVLLGLTREAIEEGDIDAVLADVDVRTAVRDAASVGGRAARVIEVVRGEDSQEPDAELRITVRSIEMGGVLMASVLIEDITQKNLADRSRNAFVAQATHELRTPLTNIRLYVEQAIDEGEDDPALRAEALNVIGSESRRLERIVSDMLCVSEIEAGSLSIRVGSVRPDTLFADLEKDYRAQAAEKSIDLVFTLPPKMPAVKGDRDRIAQALHNMIGNGLKYTPPGGRVEVGLELPDEGGMTVTVADTGIGIDPEECSQIFDRFYRANDRRIAHVTGSGLGLALAREIARLHGGDITVESAIDEGSRFTFSIPGQGDAESIAGQAA
ncbi:MAG: ATP-binding protein, partial [Planctomycetota bacterium]